jgi:hypothetical protein
MVVSLVFSYVVECVGGNATAPFFEMHHGTCVKELINAGYLWWGCLSFICVRWCVSSLLCGQGESPCWVAWISIVLFTVYEGSKPHDLKIRVF